MCLTLLLTNFSHIVPLMFFHCVRYSGNQIGPITKGNLSYFFFGPVRRERKWSCLGYQVVSHNSLCQFALLSLTGNGDVQRLEPSKWLFKIVQVWQCYCLILSLPSKYIFSALPRGWQDQPSWQEHDLPG